ncbi:MAG: transcriptional repressor LexA [Proteobacteria bacterium]|nr:transcriptional repressor LexA [Pseudomonadota bacterium]
MLTERRKKILDFLQNYFNENLRYPTIREICSHFGIKSTNGVYEHLKALERDGYISLDRKKSRAIKLNKDKNIFKRIPLLGIVSAGEPIFPVIEEGDYLEDINNLLKGTFILKVRGNSMINAGIHDGDLVSVDVDRDVKNNDIVVALLDGEVTLKRIKFDKEGIILFPENPDYSPIYVKSGFFRVLGKAKMLIRKLD